MKWEEKMAFEYFQSTGFSNIQFEPDGNTPPDLLINERIAVEVRRLNQFKSISGTYQPLEELSYRLVPRIVNYIKSYQTIPSDRTAFVFIKYSRPLNINNKLFSDIQNVFAHHLNHLDEHTTYEITENLSLRFHRAQKQFGYPYLLGADADHDGGGLVVSNVLDSLKLIIPEKEAKVAPYKSRYPIWWLALIDTIGANLDEYDFKHIKEGFNLQTYFNRIIFISSFNSSHGFELDLPIVYTP